MIFVIENGSKNLPAMAVHASEISIRKVFEKMNPIDGDFYGYISNGFLNEAQKQAKHIAISKEQQKLATRWAETLARIFFWRKARG